MATCPAGHESADLEYCDICGREMTGSPAAAAAPQVPTRGPFDGNSPTNGPRVAQPERPAAGAPCPACGAPLDGRFCEACGHDSLAAPPVSANPRPAVSVTTAPPPAQPPADTPAATWTATVSADQAYYNTVMSIGGPDAASIVFPQFCPDRYFPLRGNQISIGRRSGSRGINPDIDLTGPPEDPGVSHLHAMLIVEPDGKLSIVDLGSANGTTVNEDQSPLPPNVPHPLSAGDRVHLGAWTTITVRMDR